MANSSSELVWQCIKGSNAFLRKGSKGRADAIFSAEPGNLYNKHSYKFSGLANRQTVDIAADAGEKLKVLLTKKTAGSKKTKPTVIKGLSGKKVLKAVGAELTKFRPDLKDAGVRRAAAVQKSLRVKKALSKKGPAGSAMVVV